MRRHFYHLYADIAGFGVLSGSTLAFLAIYMARLGASNWQIGLLTAGPALVNLVLALPAGRWLVTRPLTATVFWTSIGQRLLYPLLVPLCLWVPAAWQNAVILVLVMLTSIPGTVLAIGFNALFAEAVPEVWRGEVVGRRNAILALTVLVSTLGCGQVLRVLPFTIGYAIVFAVGTVGALYSSYHLARIRLPQPLPRRVWRGAPLGVGGRSGRVLIPDAPLTRTLALRVLTSERLALGGALANRLLEPIPTDDRPPYLALYNLALNGAMLLGSLGGTAIANAIGLCEALFVATGLRLVTALLL